jgi:hypothetical protein
MNRFGAGALLLLSWLASARAGHAQEPPPRIGLFVADLRVPVAAFGSDPALAASRGLDPAQLPGPGIGVSGGAHVYPVKFGPVTIGAGVEAVLAHSRFEPSASSQPNLQAVTERFTAVLPEVSLNFGNGNGWSYLSVGVGTARRSIVPDGSEPLPVDNDRFRTIGYGGGARWFALTHLAFSIDLRIYSIEGSPPQNGLPGAPRAHLLVFSTGIALK